MKIVAFILSFYILGLNFTPCSDGGNHAEADGIELSVSVEADHGHGAYDFCSPFCLCNCCHMSVTSMDVFAQVFLKVDFDKTVFFYKSPLGIEPNLSFLQPPQV